MSNDPVKILLIEDDELDVKQIKRFLDDSKSYKFSLIHASNLSEGLDCICERDIDVILLDLSLPDSCGLDTLYKMYFTVTDIPIIVLTGLNSDKVGQKAINYGAQDYLVKGEINSNDLIHSISFSIGRLRMKLEAEREKRDHYHNEKDNHSTINPMSPLGNVLRLKESNAGVLFKSSPEIFDKLVQCFDNLIELSLLERINKKVVHNISKEANSLAREMWTLSASSSDVLNVYKAALKRKCEHVSKVKIEAYSEIGQLILIELLGDLLSLYRSQLLFPDSSTKETVEVLRKV